MSWKTLEVASGNAVGGSEEDPEKDIEEHGSLWLNAEALLFFSYARR